MEHATIATYATFSQGCDISRGSLSCALSQLPSAYEIAQAVSVGCQALSRTSPVLQQCVASDGQSALATLLASAHIPPRAATADDVQAPISPKYIYQEASCFSFQCASRRCSVLLSSPGEPLLEVYLRRGENTSSQSANVHTAHVEASEQ